MLKEILDREFRANAAYRLVAYERLPETEQAQLAALAGDGDFYGVLLSDGPPKAVDPETALLLLTLQTPGRIPAYVRHKFGRAANQAIAQLVLDDVLEMADGETFVSGAQAHAAIFGDAVPHESSAHPLARLTINALRYAQRLPPMPHAYLAQRLYRYNSVPFSLRWERQLPDETAVEAWLGTGDWMKRLWERNRSREDNGWISWRRRGVQPQELPYKLYISPRPDGLAESFQAIVQTLADHHVPSFKVGKNVYGILRPDKLVCYLPDFAGLEAVARALQELLAAYPAQGVPFTAPIDKQGLLSWGMDPPAAAQIFAGDARESWRYWVVERLAAALQTAAGSSLEVEPWQYALDRLQLEGIDTERWIPNQKMWQPWTAANGGPPSRMTVDQLS